MPIQSFGGAAAAGGKVEGREFWVMNERACSSRW